MLRLSHFQLFLPLAVLTVGVPQSASAGRGAAEEGGEKNQSINVHQHSPSILLQAESEAECQRAEEPHRESIQEWLKKIDKAGDDKDSDDALFCGVEDLATLIMKPEGGVKRSVDEIVGMIEWPVIFDGISITIEQFEEDIDIKKKKLKKITDQLEDILPLDSVDLDEVTAAIKDVVKVPDCWATHKVGAGGADAHPNMKAITELQGKIRELMGTTKTLKAEAFKKRFLILHSDGNTEDHTCKNLMIEVMGYIQQHQPSSRSKEKKKLEIKQKKLVEELKKLDNDVQTCQTYQRDLKQFQVQILGLDAIRLKAFHARLVAAGKLDTTEEELSVVIGSIASNSGLLKGIEGELVTIGASVVEYTDKITEITTAYFKLQGDVETAKEHVRDVSRQFDSNNKAVDAANKVKEYLIFFVQFMNAAYDEALKGPLLNSLGLTFTEINVNIVQQTFKAFQVSELKSFKSAKETLERLADFCGTSGIADLKLASDVEVDQKLPCAICQNTQISKYEDTMVELGGYLVARQNTVQGQVKGLMNVLDETHGANTQLERERVESHKEIEGARRFNKLYPSATFYSDYLKGWMVLAGKKRKGQPKAPQAQVLLKLWLALNDAQKSLAEKQQLANQTLQETTRQLEVTLVKQQALERSLKATLAQQTAKTDKKDEILKKLQELGESRTLLEKAKEGATQALADCEEAYRQATENLINTHAEIGSALLELGYEGEEQILEAYRASFFQEAED